MINRLFISLSMFFMLGLTSSVLSVEKISKDSVLSVMETLEQKVGWLQYRISSEEWEQYTTGKSDSLEFYREFWNYTFSDAETVKAIKSGKNLFDDDDLKRRYEIISDMIIESYTKSDREIDQLVDSLSRIDINYRAEFEGATTGSNDLYRIYRTDLSPSRRESAYRAYVSAGELKADGLSQLFVLRNEKTKNKKTENYFNSNFKHPLYSFEQYRALLDELEQASSEKYRVLIDKLRSQANNNSLEIWDLGFAFTNVNQAVDNYFPADSQLKIVKRSLIDIGFEIDKYPIFFDLASRPGKSQYAYAFPIQTPTDIRVLGNISPGLNSTKVLMHEIGHALHFAFIRQDNPLYNVMIDGVWSEGMAVTVASMVDDPKWLADYAHMPQQLIEQYLTAKKEQDLIYLRSNLLRYIFEIEAFENSDRDLNKLYWDLFERIMMLPRHDDLYPWASEIYYVTHPVYLQNYLFADMIAAQNYNYMLKSFEAVVKNKMTRSFLVQNFFRFGARYEWHDLIKRGSGEELNADYFLNKLDIN